MGDSHSVGTIQLNSITVQHVKSFSLKSMEFFYDSYNHFPYYVHPVIPNKYLQCRHSRCQKQKENPKVVNETHHCWIIGDSIELYDGNFQNSFIFENRRRFNQSDFPREHRAVSNFLLQSMYIYLKS